MDEVAGPPTEFDDEFLPNPPAFYDRQPRREGLCSQLFCRTVARDGWSLSTMTPGRCLFITCARTSRRSEIA